VHLHASLLRLSSAESRISNLESQISNPETPTHRRMIHAKR
jgi:hypothetical protein